MIVLVFLILGFRTLVYSRELFNIGVLENHTNWALLPHDDCRATLQVSSRAQHRFAIKPYFGEFPWMVLLFRTQELQKLNKHICAGTIINNRYVLTTAYCCKALTPEKSRIRVGEYSIAHSGPVCGPHWCADPVKNLKIDEIIPYKYNHTYDDDDDICLIRTQNKIRFNDYVRPICLPLREEANRTFRLGEDFQLVGWIIPNNQYSSLLKVNLSVISREDCSISGMYTKDKEICVKEQKEEKEESLLKKVCLGNIGNVLIKTLPVGHQNITYAFGILSSLPIIYSMCSPGAPRKFTKLDPFSGWILDNIKP